MKFSALVERWFSPAELLPHQVKPVIDALLMKGVKVCRVGMENPKAPTVYVFVDRPFDARALLASLADSSGLSVSADGYGIHSREYVWIGFEPGVCN